MLFTVFKIDDQRLTLPEGAPDRPGRLERAFGLLLVASLVVSLGALLS
jgi:hypothetical protein